MKKEKLKIGITGGIGAGKSLFSEYLISKNYLVINADLEAKKLISENQEIKSKIINTFGEDSFIDGVINSRLISSIVFSDKNKLELLNSIVHPFVIDKISRMIEQTSNEVEIVFVEAALIFEADMDYLFDYIILIIAEEETKIKRISQRDNLKKEEIIKRMENQIDDKEKKDLADFIIENNGSKEDFFVKSEFILSLIRSIE